MDVQHAQIGKEPPWDMLFADDLFICEHSGTEVALQIERWRETFKSRGLNVSRGKTEYRVHAMARKNNISTFRKK